MWGWKDSRCSGKLIIGTWSFNATDINCLVCRLLSWLVPIALLLEHVLFINPSRLHPKIIAHLRHIDLSDDSLLATLLVFPWVDIRCLCIVQISMLIWLHLLFGQFDFIQAFLIDDYGARTVVPLYFWAGLIVGFTVYLDISFFKIRIYQITV